MGIADASLLVRAGLPVLGLPLDTPYGDGSGASPVLSCESLCSRVAEAVVSVSRKRWEGRPLNSCWLGPGCTMGEAVENTGAMPAGR